MSRSPESPRSKTGFEEAFGVAIPARLFKPGSARTIQNLRKATFVMAVLNMFNEVEKLLRSDTRSKITEARALSMWGYIADALQRMRHELGDEINADFFAQRAAHSGVDLSLILDGGVQANEKSAVIEEAARDYLDRVRDVLAT